MTFKMPIIKNKIKSIIKTFPTLKSGKQVER
jgi:hypothetical protein